jgi:hypothetical protein
MSKIIKVLVLSSGLLGIFMCLFVGITGIQDFKTINIVIIIAVVVIVVLVDLWIFKGD